MIEEQDRDVERCACRIFFKDVCDLFRRYDLALDDVLGRGSRHFDVVRRIALDKLTGINSVVQRIAQDGENQTDRLVCESICRQLQNPMIESSGGEFLQNRLPEIREDMKADHGLIVVPRRFAHIQAADTIEPAVEESFQRDRFARHADVAVLPVGKCGGSGCIGGSAIGESAFLDDFALAVLFADLEDIRPSLASFACADFRHGGHLFFMWEIIIDFS